MAFKTTPINFLEDIPANKKLKQELLRKYEIMDEADVAHPCWDLMMSEYVSELYSLAQL
jgi:hypothetical protein